MGVVWGWALAQKVVKVVGAISGDRDGWRLLRSLVIGGVDVAVETVEAGAVLTWQPGWWMWMMRAGDGADVATETGGAGDDGLVGDMACPGDANG